MRIISFKALVIGAVAGAAIAVSAPSLSAAPSHPGSGRTVTAGHGQMQIARENRRRVVRRHVRRSVVRSNRFRAGHWRRLSVAQRAHWRAGRWWQGRRHGRLGWWWLAGGIWYWYPTAVYPYPSEVSAEAVYDYAPEGRSDDSWYYCNSPAGYYPYVKSCNGDWKAVPIQPQANSDDAYGMPPGAQNDDENAGDDQNTGDDENYNDDNQGAGDDENSGDENTGDEGNDSPGQ